MNRRQSGCRWRFWPGTLGPCKAWPSGHRLRQGLAIRKHPKVGLSRHPRLPLHFTPTSVSWLNAVENFFFKMKWQRVRRGFFRSVSHRAEGQSWRQHREIQSGTSAAAVSGCGSSPLGLRRAGSGFRACLRSSAWRRAASATMANVSRPPQTHRGSWITFCEKFIQPAVAAWRALIAT